MVFKGVDKCDYYHMEKINIADILEDITNSITDVERYQIGFKI